MTAIDFLINYNQSAIANPAESDFKLKEAKKAVNDLLVIFKKPFKLYCDGYNTTKLPPL